MKLIQAIVGFLLLTTVGHAHSSDLDSLDHFLEINGVPSEKNSGHLWHGDPKAQYFENLIREHSIRRVVEIGFCFGHSSEVFLQASPEIEVLSFDLMSHWYCFTGKQYIDLKYPNRHRLVQGDSTKTVPHYRRKHQNEKFDLILIDGGHSYEVALADLLNMQHFAKEDTILIMDDTEFGPVNRAWEKCIADGLVEEFERFSSCGLGWAAGRYIK